MSSSRSIRFSCRDRALQTLVLFDSDLRFTQIRRSYQPTTPTPTRTLTVPRRVNLPNLKLLLLHRLHHHPLKLKRSSSLIMSRWRIFGSGRRRRRRSRGTVFVRNAEGEFPLLSFLSYVVALSRTKLTNIASLKTQEWESQNTEGTSTEALLRVRREGEPALPLIRVPFVSTEQNPTLIPSVLSVD